MNPASTSLSFGWVSVSVPETEELEALSSLSIVTNFPNLPEGIKKSVTSVGRRQVPFNFNQRRKCGDQIFDGERPTYQGIPLYVQHLPQRTHTHNSFFVDLKTE